MLNHVQRCLMLPVSPDFTVRKADMWQHVIYDVSRMRSPSLV